MGELIGYQVLSDGERIEQLDSREVVFDIEKDLKEITNVDDEGCSQISLSPIFSGDICDYVLVSSNELLDRLYGNGSYKFTTEGFEVFPEDEQANRLLRRAKRAPWLI